MKHSKAERSKPALDPMEFAGVTVPTTAYDLKRLNRVIMRGDSSRQCPVSAAPRNAFTAQAVDGYLCGMTMASITTRLKLTPGEVVLQALRCAVLADEMEGLPALGVASIIARGQRHRMQTLQYEAAGVPDKQRKYMVPTIGRVR